MAAAVRLETRRILLPGYGCQMWYLGERVYHWHLGPSRRRVPFPIPSSMLWSCSLTGPELRVALEGYDASTLLERSHHYQQYIQENILEQVPTGAAEVCFFDILFFSFLHLVLIIIFSSRRLALLLLVRPWRSRLILRGLRLREPVILSMLRQYMERPHLALLWVTSLSWIAPCTTGLLLFRLLSSSALVLMWHSLLSFLLQMLLMWV